MQYHKLYAITVNSVQTDNQGEPVISETFYGCYPFHVDIVRVRNNLTSMLNSDNYTLAAIKPLNATIFDCLDAQRYQVANLYRAFHHLDYSKFVEALGLEPEAAEGAWKWQRFRECAQAMRHFTLEEIESIVEASGRTDS